MAQANIWKAWNKAMETEKLALANSAFWGLARDIAVEEVSLRSKELCVRLLNGQIAKLKKEPSTEKNLTSIKRRENSLKTAQEEIKNRKKEISKLYAKLRRRLETVNALAGDQMSKKRIQLELKASVARQKAKWYKEKWEASENGSNRFKRLYHRYMDEFCDLRNVVYYCNSENEAKVEIEVSAGSNDCESKNDASIEPAGVEPTEAPESEFEGDISKAEEGVSLSTADLTLRVRSKVEIIGEGAVKLTVAGLGRRVFDIVFKDELALYAIKHARAFDWLYVWYKGPPENGQYKDEDIEKIMIAKNG